MKTTVICLLLVGISGTFAQPVPVTTKNGTAIDGSAAPVGSPSDLRASKVASSGVASASLSYGKVAVPSYDREYPNAYPASCYGHPYGYYGNPEYECKTFHFCAEDGRLSSFECPPYTRFNNYLSICDWPHKVDYNCDPVYKDEEYPAKTYSNEYPAKTYSKEYPADRSYAPNFYQLYPVAKPVTPVYVYEKSYERPVYPILPEHKQYPVGYSARPYVPAYDAYDKPSYPAYHNSYEKSSYQPMYEKLSYKTPVYEKVEKYAYEKPAYEKPAYEKPAYEKPAYEKPVYGPVHEKYDKPVYEKVSYKSYSEKPIPAIYEYKPVYHAEKPVQKPVYGDYVEEKPYPVEAKPVYPQKPTYSVEKPVYPTEKTYQEEKPAYPTYKAEAPVYQEIKAAYVPVYNAEKPVYPVEKPAYDKPAYDKPIYEEKYPTYQTPAYPEDKPVYEKPAPAYPQEKREYVAEKYPTYPVEKPQYVAEKYPTYAAPSYPAEKPLYQEYPVDKYEYVQGPDYPKNEAYADKPYTPVVVDKTYTTYKPAYEKKYENAYPTSVSSYASAIKNYNEYVSRYGPARDYAYGVAPYNNHRSRPANYPKSH
ncbi:hypothetical protein RvY_01427 [Ramazzottius varieornatus]|uniref:Chitin-binding type-2 domain-containing protein n=1 Tax=Ramazzottius varieornatus TaxID=947166 RepID=A0A1D1UMC3_RAMVA|nr:hypothetical protein RvY_01427 [Ramazzottius varieornatus]